MFPQTFAYADNKREGYVTMYVNILLIHVIHTNSAGSIMNTKIPSIILFTQKHASKENRL